MKRTKLQSHSNKARGEEIGGARLLLPPSPPTLLRPYPRDDHPERDLRVGRKGGGRRVTLHFQLGGNQPLLEGGGPLM